MLFITWSKHSPLYATRSSISCSQKSHPNWKSSTAFPDWIGSPRHRRQAARGRAEPGLQTLLPTLFVVLLQASREDSRSTISTTPPCGGSQRLLEETLQKSAPYPMIVLPPGGGYWVDGQDHECPFDTRGNPILPHATWRAKFEMDDTAKCYRRFFVGRVSSVAVPKHVSWMAGYLTVAVLKRRYCFKK